MNKIYKVLRGNRNQAVVTSELGKAHGKKTTAVAGALLAVGLMTASTGAWAGVTGFNPARDTEIQWNPGPYFNKYFVSTSNPDAGGPPSGYRPVVIGRQMKVDNYGQFDPNSKFFISKEEFAEKMTSLENDIVQAGSEGSNVYRTAIIGVVKANMAGKIDELQLRGQRIVNINRHNLEVYGNKSWEEVYDLMKARVEAQPFVDPKDIVGNDMAMNPSQYVNLYQLKTLENKQNTTESKLNNLTDGAVMYDDPGLKDKVTLNPGGAAATIANVKDGVANNDAVNKGQLNAVETKADNAAQAAQAADVKAQAAQTTATKAVNDAAAADTKATQAAAAAQVADQKAQGAQNTADQANTAAQQADAKAVKAGQDAAAADQKATQAGQAAQAADAKAQAAQNTASQALNDAAVAKNTADNAQATAQAADRKAEDAKAAAAVADGKAVAAQNTANANTDRIVVLEESDRLNVKYNGLDKSAITLAGNGGTLLDGVKDGSVQAGSKQAVNGGQLHEVDSRLTQNFNNLSNQVTGLGNKTDMLGQTAASNLGGGTTYNPATGALSQPNYVVQGNTYNNVGSAVEAIDGSLTNHDTRITLNRTDIDNITQGKAGLVLTDGQTTTVDASGTSTVLALGGLSGPRVVKGVEDGQVAAGSKEAVNGGQLFAAEERLKGQIGTVKDDVKALGDKTTRLGETAAANFGGGSVYNAQTGSLSAPAYTVNNVVYNDVGSAVEAVDNVLGSHNVRITHLEEGLVLTNDQVAQNTTNIANYNTRITNNTTNITNVIEGRAGLVLTDGQTITVGKTDSAVRIDVAGPGGDRVIGGVAPGVQDNDAVNKGQLDRAIAGIVTNNSAVDGLRERVEANRKFASQGIASALSMDIEYPAQHPGEWAAGVGIGHYDGQTALGLGINYLSKSGRVKVYGGLGQALHSHSRPAIKTGVSFVF